MSDLDHIRSKVAQVTEMLKEMQKRRSEDQQPWYPTSDALIKTLKRRPQSLDHDEQPEQFTADDYDIWVYQALADLTSSPPRFHSCPDNPTLIECPRARVLRIGREAEQDNQSSPLFQELMMLTQDGKTLPKVTKRSMRTAQRYLDVVCAFREFAARFASTRKNFRDLKREFLAQRVALKIFVSDSTLERALKANDLDWSAYSYSTPRKGKRKKPDNS